MEWAASRLRQRGESHKCLIVLADHYYARSISVNAPEELHGAVLQIIEQLL